MKWKVLISVPGFEERCSAGMKILRENDCEVTVTQKGRQYTPEELKEIISDKDAAIAGVDIWDAEVFRHAPRLKGVARFGTGTDNFNLEDMKAYGIHATNTPGVNRNAVAEHTVALLLSVVRQIPRLNNETRKGTWERFITHELKGQTVGMFGFGGIARNVSEKLIPFEVRLIAYDKYPDTAEAERLGVKMCSMDELFGESDIILIHAPYTEETCGIINADTVSKMKDGVYIINTARGPIVREHDLYAALSSGKVAGYGTDVFEREPVDLNNPLFGLENYVCTPHTAAESYENYEQTGILTAEQTVAMLNGETPEHLLV